jgi:hypothetical protein
MIFKNWFKKKEKEPKNLFYEKEIRDGIEESLWEIKEEYDLPTEEINIIVKSKRENIDFLHKSGKKTREPK